MIRYVELVRLCKKSVEDYVRRPAGRSLYLLGRAHGMLAVLSCWHTARSKVDHERLAAQMGTDRYERLAARMGMDR